MVDALRAGHTSAKKVAQLEHQFKEAKAQQGFMGKAWNGFKEAFNVGQSEYNCEKMLDKFKSGKVSFDEALQYIEDFETKQKNMTGLISNIATGVGSIAAATVVAAGGPITWGCAAMATGAAAGAAVKTAVNIADRATNEIEDDALNTKAMAKDFLSGALTGATSAVSSGVGAGIKAGKFGLTIKNGVTCGVECGALSGALGYMTDVAFGDKDFEGGELVKNSLTSAAVSGTVGAVVGGGMYALSSLTGSVGKEISKTTAQTIVQDSTSSSARKILGQVERDIAGVAIGSVASNVTNNGLAA